MKTVIIAEAGVNHNGQVDLAVRLVDAAADAGADIVKFQTFTADRLVTAAARQAAYQTRATGREESQHAMLRRLELDREAHEAVIARCRTRGITFLSTGFDLESLALLTELGVGAFKIPSGEITNLPYLRWLGRSGKPLILSTGMATMGDIEGALAALEDAGTARDRITVLHCTTEYPTPMTEVNLRAMVSIRDAFGVAVGYSDHTMGIEVAVAAVALGATMIEKHLTLDRNLPGPDHQASLEPGDLARMVSAIRNIEQAMGDGIKRPTPSESKNRVGARKSIVAACAIRAGERFSEANLAVKRPATGVSPMQWDEMIGRVATRDYLPDDTIER